MYVICADDGEEDGEGGWGDDDSDLELEGDDDDADGGDGAGVDDSTYYVPPTKGVPTTQFWTQNSSLAADHIAAGSFESAMAMLNKQIGVVDFAAFKPFFMAVYHNAQSCMTGMTNVPGIPYCINRNWKDAGAGEKQWRGALPASGLKLQSLVGQLQGAYKAFTGGKFDACIKAMRKILYQIPLLVVENRTDLEDANELLERCREYILGAMVEVTRRDLMKDNKSPSVEEQMRNCELAAYFTHCNLDPVHLILTLKSAQTYAFKLKNFKDAGSFARRLLELGPKPDLASKSRKIMQACDKDSSNAQKLDYDPLNPFAVSGDDFKPIYKGTPSVSMQI